MRRHLPTDVYAAVPDGNLFWFAAFVLAFMACAVYAALSDRRGTR